jgi:hypothetical protein
MDGSRPLSKIGVPVVVSGIHEDVEEILRKMTTKG